MKSIDARLLPDDLKADYYEDYYYFYSYYGTNLESDAYMREMYLYMDSLLSVLDKGTYRYKINLARKQIDYNLLDFAEDLFYVGGGGTLFAQLRHDRLPLRQSVHEDRTFRSRLAILCLVRDQLILGMDFWIADPFRNWRSITIGEANGRRHSNTPS